jgi:site-specific recombinase XerD
LEAFLAEETARGRRPRGVEGLAYRVRYFLSYLEEQERNAAGVDVNVAHDYQGALLARHEGKVGTVASYVNAAGVFCGWLADSGFLLSNPFDLLARPRLPETVPAGILTESETDALLAALRVVDPKRRLSGQARRYVTHVVAELQYASGLRIAEVANLTPEDVDTERALVRVKEGKHGSERYAFLTDYACEVLEIYATKARPVLYRVAVQEREGKQNRAALLFHTTHATLQCETNRELARACSEAGVQRITSHGFRHALGYHLLRAGCPLRYIQAILGHKHLADTEVYTKVDVADVQAVFDRCHPRSQG